MKILVVGPVAEHRAAVVSTLFRRSNSELPYDINEANDCDAARQVFASFHPDLVIIALYDHTDQERAFCHYIREKEDKRHTGIIFLAHGAGTPDVLSVECLELGADDFLMASTSPREMLARVNVVLRMKAMTDELRSANHRLEILSLTDELTGLHNMRSFNIEYTKMLRQCAEGAFGMGVLMMDLDHFKSVNDTANHLVGSHVISQVGTLMRLCGFFGKDSCGARYGGDEFVLCAPVENGELMMAQAEALRQMIGKAVFKKDVYSVSITASIGISYVEPGFDGKPDDPIKGADVMLYRSKELGRNRVSGMILRYPVDFDHIGRAHLIDGDAGGDHHHVSGPNQLKVFK